MIHGHFLSQYVYQNLEERKHLWSKSTFNRYYKWCERVVCFTAVPTNNVKTQGRLVRKRNIVVAHTVIMIHSQPIKV